MLVDHHIKPHPALGEFQLIIHQPPAAMAANATGSTKVLSPVA